jgi:hypothetical protein
MAWGSKEDNILFLNDPSQAKKVKNKLISCNPVLGYLYLPQKKKRLYRRPYRLVPGAEFSRFMNLPTKHPCSTGSMLRAF